MPDLGITLDESNHTYWWQGRQLASAGSLVRELTPPFDAEAKAAELGARRGVDPAALRAEWDAKRDRAADKGHALHGFIQGFFDNPLQQGPFPPNAYRECAAWLDWWSARGQRNLKVVGHELIVGFPELGFAGRLDSLFESTKTIKAHVLDWKTNEEFTVDNRWGDQMLDPFGDLPKCHLSEYSIQLSLYRLALERVGVQTGHAYIVHLGDKATAHRALDLRRRLEQWLKERKQE